MNRPRELPRFQDPFDLHAQLGVGGTSTVYLATTRSGIVRPDALLAVKVVERQESPLSHRAAFREWKIGRRISHEGLPHYVQFLRGESRPTMVAMDYVPGVNMETLLDRGSLPIPMACEVMMRVCDALTYLHELADEEGPFNAVHGDIKPGNLMITPDGHVVLMDLGVARYRGEENFFKPGTTVGTPPYMSPEQAQGHLLDARSDLFSLASVFFTFVTGQNPFEDEIVARSNAEAQQRVTRILLRIAQCECTRWMRQAMLDSLGEVGEIISTCHCFDPEGRVQTARELRARIAAARRALSPLGRPLNPSGAP